MPDMMTPSPEEHDGKEVEVREVNPFGGGRAGKWFENFWYHYKFQTLAAAFAAIAILICVVQCAVKPKNPTFSICYAGKLNFGISMSGSAPTQHTIKNALTPLAADIAEEDNEKKIEDLISLYGYTIDDSSQDATVLDLSRQNKENLRAELDAANAYIFLLGEDVYHTYAFSPSDKAPYMVPVAPYLPANAEAAGYRITSDGYGVYLHSTPLAEISGFKELPQDTILSLRTSFSLFKRDSKKQRNLYAQNEALFRAMLAGDLSRK